MLQLTEAALVVIDATRAEHRIPDSYGIRVSGGRTDTGELSLNIGFSIEPGEDDVIGEQHGRRVFVARDVADTLADVELDASLLAGNNGATPATLVLRPQDPG